MKKILFAAIIAVFVVGVSAFAIKQKPAGKQPVQKYFIYTAYPSQTSTDLNNPANYSLTANNGQEPLDCPEGDLRCGVQAQDNGSGQPVMSGATIFTRE